MLTIKVSGQLEIASILDKLHDPALIEDILDAGQAILLNRIRQRYLAEVDPDKVPWVPSKAGLKRRAKGGTGTLFKTGKLFHSIQLFSRTDGERRMGTDVPYARYHQYGEGDMHRPFLGFNDDDVTVMEKYVTQQIKQALA